MITLGSSMAAMIRISPWHFWQMVMSILNTLFSNRARICVWLLVVVACRPGPRRLPLLAVDFLFFAAQFVCGICSVDPKPRGSGLSVRVALEPEPQVFP